jgi:hypothetical protein
VMQNDQLRGNRLQCVDQCQSGHGSTHASEYSGLGKSFCLNAKMGRPAEYFANRLYERQGQIQRHNFPRDREMSWRVPVTILWLWTLRRDAAATVGDRDCQISRGLVILAWGLEDRYNPHLGR